MCRNLVRMYKSIAMIGIFLVDCRCCCCPKRYRTTGIGLNYNGPSKKTHNTWLPPWLWQGHKPISKCISSGLAAESMHLSDHIFAIYKIINGVKRIDMRSFYFTRQ